MTQNSLPIFAELDASAQERRVNDHLESLRLCWPDYEGPRVEATVHGLCSVNTCVVHSLTHGENRYHYMAPCRIESISEDGRTIIAVVEYPTEGITHQGTLSCAELYNGERLRLDITDLWAPVAHLTGRYAA